ncbi:uncharacterized protein LOC134828361 [Culicoides brevitarsis]|uniref:uncharacterized protein LOC134828361 n=1 Tax=Culicoides brevitarsis TaxID=469753 RepID=UPI00307C6AB0
MSNLSFQIPSWMDKNYFEDVLRHFKNNETLKITNYELKPASKAGDGFASSIFRVICQTGDEEISLIVKTVPIEEGLKRSMINHERAYETEIKMYAEILPEMEKILLKVTGKAVKIGPQMIHFSLKPSPVLILEDLVRSRGCEMSEKTFGLEESVRIMKRLAQFHASSVVINEKIKNLTEMRNSFFHIDKKKEFNLAKIVLQPNVKRFIEAVESRGDYNSVIIERLKYFYDHFEELMEEVYISTDNKKHFVLTHNDFHRKNMLFRMKNGTFEEFYVFDYQFCLWSTPIIDFCYFFYQVANTETRQKHRSDLLAVYLDEFQKILKAFNCKSTILSLNDLEEDFRQHKAAEINQIITFFKFQFMTFNDEDLKNASDKEPMSKTDAVFASDAFHEAVKPELERLLGENGF